LTRIAAYVSWYSNPCFNYDTGGLHLQAVSEETNLGVIISHDLKWENNAYVLLLELLIGFMM